MREELITLLEEAFEAGIITSTAQAQIDAIKKKLQLPENEYNQIEDKIRLEAYLHKVKEREKKGITFIGDLRKQYKITDEDKVVIQEKLKSDTKKAAASKQAEVTRKAEALKQSDSQKQSEPAKPAEQKKPTGAKPLVLVADDNESMLLLARKIIEDNNYACITADSPEATARLIAEKQPAVIFCDINFGIGKPTGMDVFTNIRTKKIMTPFIIVSAFIQKEFKDHARRIGITDYITKPIEADQLVSLIKKYVS